ALCRRRGHAPACGASPGSPCDRGAGSCGGLGPLARLACLAADLLVSIPHALALVRLGRPHSADVGGDLADVFYRDSVDRELGRILDLDRDSLRRLEPNRVRVAEV